MTAPCARSGRTGLATLAVVALLAAPLLLPAAASAEDADPVEEATARLVDFIRSNQESDGAFRGDGSLDTGTFHSWQAIVALSAAGLDTREVRASPGDPSAVDWLRDNRALYLTENTPWQRQTLAIAASYANPGDFGGHDYVASLRGEVSDGEVGRPDFTNEDIFAILAFRAAGVPADDPDVQAIHATILDHRNEDGGWGAGPRYPSDTDMTGAALAAVVAGGLPLDDARVRGAVDWLREAQTAPGGFAMDQDGSRPNVQSTAWALWGLRSAGEEPATWVNDAGNDPVTYLAGTVREDGRVVDASGNVRGLWESIDVLTGIQAAHYPVKGWLPVDASVTTSDPLATEPVRFADAGPGTRHEWDLGDGTILECDASGCTSSDGTTTDTAEHAYAEPGTYEVTVDAWDDAYGHNFDALTVDVAPRPPVAEVEASTHETTRGVDVTFDALGSHAPDGSIDAFRWTFGDGNSLDWGDHAVVDHAFGDVGTFTVKVTVRDDAGQTASAYVQVTVENKPPVVEPFPDATTDQYVNVTFDANATDPDAPDDALTYDWDLGDGNATTGERVTHAYEEAGTFTVTLNVTDADGGAASTSFDVTVEAAAPPPEDDDESGDEPDEGARVTAENLTADPERPRGGEDVTFTVDAVSHGGGELTFEWDFGDGHGAETDAAESVHAYEDPGRYTVHVTATDENGTSDNASLNLTVRGPPDEKGPGKAKGARSASAPASPEPEAPAPSLNAPDTVNVRADASFSVADAPGNARYRFDFGDGNATPWRDGPVAAHAYGAPGAYEASVTVETPDGDARTLRALVVVENAAPEVRVLEPENGTMVAPGVLTLRGDAWDPDGEVASVKVWAGANAADVTGASSWTARLDLSDVAPASEVDVRVRATDADGVTGPETRVRVLVEVPDAEANESAPTAALRESRAAASDVMEAPFPAFAALAALGIAVVLPRAGRRGDA